MEAHEDFVHVGPGSLAGKLLRRFWQPVLVGDELEIGRPKRIQVLNEYFTAYRGADGVARIVQDACPHRQTRLFLGWVEGDCIRCFYHGWKFGPDGRCVEQPAESEAFRHKVAIRAYPTREYLGLVFAYLGEGAAPDFPVMPEIDIERDTVLYNRHPVPCNYFQRIENDMDELHLHFVHKVSTDEIGLIEFPDIDVTETDYGILRRGLRKENGHNVTRTAYWMMPNVLMTFTPGRPSRPQWMLHLAWRVPITDSEMCSFIVAANKGGGEGLKPRPETKPDPNFLTDEVLAGRLRVQDIDPDYPGLFNVQDNVALAGQGPMVDRSKDRLGQSDKAVIFLRRMWARELKALAEGRAPKPWRRPARSFFTERSKEMELAGAIGTE
ncbi:MAG TPA: Rieske 2Fe-2S domain-containing protein [Stellaceae bacterium]|nr:Rieske 2Fe-2S domain-containing protein [Stellaceae bacterium]